MYPNLTTFNCVPWYTLDKLWNKTPFETTNGQSTKYIKIYVVISNIELIGPIHNINVFIDFASHWQGLSNNSSSTLSQGIAVQDKSYIKFNIIKCKLSIGKNGNIVEATNTDNILPKLEDAVIFIYFIIFA